MGQRWSSPTSPRYGFPSPSLPKRPPSAANITSSPSPASNPASPSSKPRPR
jgi:hypothetical protein